MKIRAKTAICYFYTFQNFYVKAFCSGIVVKGTGFGVRLPDFLSWHQDLLGLYFVIYNTGITIFIVVVFGPIIVEWEIWRTA